MRQKSAYNEFVHLMCPSKHDNIAEARGYRRDIHNRPCVSFLKILKEMCHF